MRYLHLAAAAIATLCLAGAASAQKHGSILKINTLDSPASMSNPELDKLIDRQSIEPNQDKRKQLV